MGKFLALSALSVVAVALMAGCADRQPIVVVLPPQQPASTTVVAPPSAAAAPAVVHGVELRPGMGRIESMGTAPSASAGGTSPSVMHRLNIRMDDGSMQLVDTTSSGLAVGDRVEITREGFIRRIPT